MGQLLYEASHLYLIAHYASVRWIFIACEHAGAYTVRYCFTNSSLFSVGIVSKWMTYRHVFYRLVLLGPAQLQNSDGNPLSRDIKYKGLEYFANIAL